jgi:hypothetical protein
MTSDKKEALSNIIDKNSFDTITKKLLATRKVINLEETTYEEVELRVAGKLLKLRGIHIPLDKVYPYASGRCKTCSCGKGYYISNILKSQYPDPRGFMVLEPEMPEGLSEDQQKIMQAKFDKIPTWKLINTCECAAKKALLKNSNWVSTANRNVFLELDYNFEEEPIEDTKVEEPVEQEK